MTDLKGPRDDRWYLSLMSPNTKGPKFAWLDPTSIYINGEAFHALLDDGQAYKAYNVYLIPRFLVIDADQVVRVDSAGRSLLADDIISMVEEFSPPPAVDSSS